MLREDGVFAHKASVTVRLNLWSISVGWGGGSIARGAGNSLIQ